jgi:hypothetical protein
MTPKDFLKMLPDWPPLDVPKALEANLKAQAAIAVWMADHVEDALPLGVVPITEEGLKEHAERMVSLVEMTHPDIREVVSVMNVQERQLRRLAGAHA